MGIFIRKLVRELRSQIEAAQLEIYNLLEEINSLNSEKDWKPYTDDLEQN